MSKIVFGSYEQLTPAAYETYYPNTWQHAGSDQWSASPVPNWGNNPLLVGAPRLAISGDEVPGPVTSGRSYGPAYLSGEEGDVAAQKKFYVLLGLGAALAFGMAYFANKP